MMGFDYGIIFIIPITLIIAGFFFVIGKKYNCPKPFYVICILGIIYINCAIGYAFFPITFIDMPGFSIFNNINMKVGFYRANYVQLLLNILLTFPIGVGAQFVTNMRNRGRLLFVCIVSFSIEMIQLMILFAFKPVDVFFDVNDIICNVLGGILGYIVMYVLNSFFKNSKYQNPEKIFGFIKNVCINCANNKKSLDNRKCN